MIFGVHIDDSTIFKGGLLRCKWLLCIGIGETIAGAFAVLAGIEYSTTDIEMIGLLPGAILMVAGMLVIRTGAKQLFFDRRKMQGRCLRCGYQLLVSQLGCPECGWNRPENEEKAEDNI